MTTNKRIALGVGAGLVVGFGVGLLAFGGNSADTELLQDTETPDVVSVRDLNEADGRTALDALSAVETEEVLVKDQPAGMRVFISRVALTAPGWVVVAEESGAILGAARFDAGVYQGMVELLRGTTAGEPYTATIWHDDGDRLFDHTKDTTTATGMTFETYDPLTEG